MSNRIQLAFCMVPLLIMISCGKEPQEQARPSSESSGGHHKLRPRRSSANGLTVRTSVYSGSDDFASGGRPLPARALPLATESEDVRADELCRRLVGADKRAQLAILEEAQGLGSTALLKVVDAMLLTSDAEIRGRALALLEGYASSLMVPLAVKALADSDTDVRLEALEIVSTIREASVLAVYQTALKDREASVRIAAFTDAAMRNDAVYPQIVQEAVASKHGDVALAALNHMRVPESIAHIDPIIRCLGHSDPNVRDLAHEILYLTFQVDLRAPDIAASWWSRKRHLFDEQLTLKDPSTLPLLEAP